MSTTTQELGAERWTHYFDSIGASIEGQLVTIEVMSDELGDQVDVERLPLQAISYDANENMLEVSVGGRGPRYPVLLRHFISQPQTITLEESGRLVPDAILVTDASDTRTLIRLIEPPTLMA
ncbi:MAG TPA: DUF5335 family protein [Solirubrobacteraceae bacterium]